MSEPQPMPTLVIQLLPDGAGVVVRGRLGDKVLCLGMLAAAMGVVQSCDPSKQPKVVLPEPHLNGGVNRLP